MVIAIVINLIKHFRIVNQFLIKKKDKKVKKEQTNKEIEFIHIIKNLFYKYFYKYFSLLNNL